MSLDYSTWALLLTIFHGLLIVGNVVFLSIFMQSSFRSIVPYILLLMVGYV
jgi:hypothetical protein